MEKDLIKDEREQVEVMSSGFLTTDENGKLIETN